MATTIPMSTPMRQPFGELDQSKLRKLQSLKNRQNAITPSSAPSLKRRALSPETSDSENVDPNLVDLIGKRKRACFDDDVSAPKPSHYGLSTITTARPQGCQIIKTPPIDTFTPTAPVSAPPAAGRSPTKPKKHGLHQSRRHFAPPTFGIKTSSLSISAALNGTIAHKKPKKVRTIEESKPKSWFFDIFEEPEQVQSDRMNEWTISQSAISLDISDDESKSKKRTDRGKENIDPNEVSAPLTRSMAAAKAASQDLRKDFMTDDVRSPLGDLNPAEYYAEGLDATSAVLVQEDVQDGEEVEPSVVDEASAQDESTVETAQNVPVEELDAADIGAVILAAAPNWETETLVEARIDNALMTPQQDDLDIWESESAKDENERLEVKQLEDNVFVLQDL